MAGGAWCAFDRFNTWQGDFMEKFYATTPLMAETKTCLNAVLWAVRQQWRRITIKTDCQVLVQLLQNGKVVEHEVANIIDDIQTCASTFMVCNILKVKRNVVERAHNIAKLCMSSNSQ